MVGLNIKDLRLADFNCIGDGENRHPSMNNLFSASGRRFANSMVSTRSLIVFIAKFIDCTNSILK